MKFKATNDRKEITLNNNQKFHILFEEGDCKCGSFGSSYGPVKAFAASKIRLCARQRRREGFKGDAALPEISGNSKIFL